MKVNFTGCSLTGSVFDGSNLSGAILPQDLTNISWGNANLYGAKMIKSELTGADLSECQSLENADLTTASAKEVKWPKNCMKVNFTGCSLTGSVFDGSNLSGAILPQDLTNIIWGTANLYGAKMIKSDLTGADLSKCQTLENADLTAASAKEVKWPKNCMKVNFTGCSLTGSVFDGSNLNGVILHKASVNRVKWLNVTVTNVDYSDLDLSEGIFDHTNFQVVKMNNTNFTKCKLSNVTFPHFAESPKCKFTHASLENVSFNQSGNFKTNWSHTDFSHAKLTKVRFSKVNLQEANFQNAHLIQSTLYDVNYSNANFTDATLEGCNPDIRPYYHIIGRPKVKN
jgi:uncharacterized protein YjbI with pentapeptide repeats